MGNKKVTTDTFINRAIEKHGKKYNYSKSIYVGGKEKIIIICKKHGEFQQLPSNHLAGKGCKMCAVDDSSIRYMHNQDDVIEKFNKIHSNFYDYSLTKYNGCKNKIKIICPKHGVFEQTADAHMVGKGCIECSKQYLNYRRSSYVDRCNDKHDGLSNFYILKMKDIDGTEFYKVGITTQKIKFRYRSNSMPYQYKVVRFIKSRAKDVFDTELNIKKQLTNNTYKPKIDFDGSRYECFSHIPTHIYEMIDSLVSCNNERVNI